MATTLARDVRSGAGAHAAPALEPAPRARRFSWVLLGVLLVAGSGLAFMVWAGAMNERTPVLVFATALRAGDVVTEADVTAADVAATGPLALMGATRRADVVGRRVAASVEPGTPVSESLLAGAGVVRRRQAVVGVALEPGELPAGGVQPGDPVMVVEVPAGDGAADPAEQPPRAWPARIHLVEVGGDEAAAPGVTVVSLAVGAGDAPAVAAAAALDRVRLVLVASLDDIPAHLLPEAAA